MSDERQSSGGGTKGGPATRAAEGQRGKTGSGESSLRIGDVARLVGTTPRTIRYYEEIGLLPGSGPRNSGQHRLYTEVEVERLREVMRLKELLGVSLDELKTLLEAEEARAAVRAELQREDVDPARRLELVRQALGHLDRQLELVERRWTELARLREELRDRRQRVRGHIRALEETLEEDRSALI